MNVRMDYYKPAHCIEMVQVGVWDVELMSDGSIWLTSYYKNGRGTSVHYLGRGQRLADEAKLPAYLHKAVAKLQGLTHTVGAVVQEGGK